MEQSWYGRNGGNINNIFCSKKTKVPELGKDSGLCCCVKINVNEVDAVIGKEMNMNN